LDAHAKNYSLLLGGPHVRLAPLYDVASILPYEEYEIHKLKLSMKVRGEHNVDKIGLRQWQKFASETHVNADTLIEGLIAMAKQLPDEINAARVRARKEGLAAANIERLTARLIERAGDCLRLLAAA
jgi:serine/threonine-protein kinase HipA